MHCSLPAEINKTLFTGLVYFGFALPADATVIVDESDEEDMSVIRVFVAAAVHSYQHPATTWSTDGQATPYRH